jgi:hypothetical protein
VIRGTVGIALVVENSKKVVKELNTSDALGFKWRKKEMSMLVERRREI